MAFVLQSTTNLRLIGTSDGTLSDTSTQLMRSVRAKVKVMQESMSHAFFATPQAGYLSEAMAQAKPAAQTAVFALFSGAAYASHLRPDATVALYFQFKTTISRENSAFQRRWHCYDSAFALSHPKPGETCA